MPLIDQEAESKTDIGGPDVATNRNCTDWAQVVKEAKGFTDVLDILGRAIHILRGPRVCWIRAPSARDCEGHERGYVGKGKGVLIVGEASAEPVWIAPTIGSVPDVFPPLPVYDPAAPGPHLCVPAEPPAVGKMDRTAKRALEDALVWFVDTLTDTQQAVLYHLLNKRGITLAKAETLRRKAGLA